MIIHRLTTKSSPDAREYPFLCGCRCEERCNDNHTKKIGKAAGNRVDINPEVWLQILFKKILPLLAQLQLKK